MGGDVLMSKHHAKRLHDANGVLVGYEYRDTIIDKTYWADGPTTFAWIISGFGPDGWTDWRKLEDAKAYIDTVKDDAND